MLLLSHVMGGLRKYIFSEQIKIFGHFEKYLRLSGAFFKLTVLFVFIMLFQMLPVNSPSQYFLSVAKE